MRWAEGYLCQFVPELVQIQEHLGMYLRVTDAVDVAQDSQNPPPEHGGGVGVPAGEAAPGDDADVVGQALAAVCGADRRVASAR